MIIVVPISISSDLIGAGCSLAEDPTGAWVAGTYSVGDERHVVATHRVYRCAVAGSSTVTPQNDPTRWADHRPTNRMAPFDFYKSTAAESSAADIVYPITARFVDSVALYGLDGSEYEVVVRDSVGGAVIATRAGALRVRGGGWFNYLFGRAKLVDRLLISGLPIRPAAEITVTIKAGAGARRAVGMIAMGRLKQVAGVGFGGSQYGATAEPFTNSFIRADDDGSLTIVRRNNGTNLRGTLSLPRRNADAAVTLLQSVLDVPLACIVTQADGFSGLNCFGLISSAPVRYSSDVDASIDYVLKGII